MDEPETKFVGFSESTQKERRRSLIFLSKISSLGNRNVKELKLNFVYVCLLIFVHRTIKQRNNIQANHKCLLRFQDFFCILLYKIVWKLYKHHYFRSHIILFSSQFLFPRMFGLFLKIFYFNRIFLGQRDQNATQKENFLLRTWSENPRK